MSVSSFYKQETAYDKRISDWSSDVCSSDLLPRARRYREVRREPQPLGGRTVLERIVGLSIRQRWFVLAIVGLLFALGVWCAFRLPVDAVPDITNVQVQINRSEERREGKEWGCTCEKGGPP